jgi:hypothetical protein
VRSSALWRELMRTPMPLVNCVGFSLCALNFAIAPMPKLINQHDNINSGASKITITIFANFYSFEFPYIFV